LARNLDRDRILDGVGLRDGDLNLHGNWYVHRLGNLHGVRPGNWYRIRNLHSDRVGDWDTHRNRNSDLLNLVLYISGS
jgi:hypothetical protein